MFYLKSSISIKYLSNIFNYIVIFLSFSTKFILIRKWTYLKDKKWDLTITSDAALLSTNHLWSMVFHFKLFLNLYYDRYDRPIITCKADLKSLQ